MRYHRIHTGDLRRRQNRRVDVACAAAGRRADDNLGHSRDLGGNNAHQQRRWQGRCAAWHIYADRINTAESVGRASPLARHQSNC